LQLSSLELRVETQIKKVYGFFAYLFIEMGKDPTYTESGISRARIIYRVQNAGGPCVAGHTVERFATPIHSIHIYTTRMTSSTFAGHQKTNLFLLILGSSAIYFISASDFFWAQF
jgi:hypothetical protein